jgi:uncharacterized protein YxeA
MRKAFSLIEIIIVILLLVIVGSFFRYKNTNTNNIEQATKRLILYLKQTRYQAQLDNTYDETDSLWYKKRWTLKFFNCSKNIGGLYYSIYSDTNKKGHPNLNESLNDPLTNKKVYSSNKCIDTSRISKYVLLTKHFDITNIDISCNSTSSLGQISFGQNGKIYTKLSSYTDDSSRYELKKRCIITLYDSNNNIRQIGISPETGFIEEIASDN